MRVAVVGGGLAGPCLAHGLRRAGIEVALFERDTAAASRGQGYRIRIAPEGELALRRCLPPHLHRLVMATAGTPSTGVTIFDGGLREVHRVTFPRPTDTTHGESISVDRLVLREILLSGLSGVVRHGAAFTRYEELPGGGVRAHFASGEVADADVLVAADGAGSLVRRQRLPAAQVADTGLRTIFGKVPLTAEALALVPARSLEGFSTVAGDRGRFMPLAGMRFRTDPVAAAAEHAPDVRFTDTRDYLMWVFGAPAALLGMPDADLFALAGEALTALVGRLVADWHPSITDLLRLSDPATVRALPVRTALPVPPWEPTAVTLVGDAIHCMVPAGIGAAVALRDADLLTTQLAGGTPPGGDRRVRDPDARLRLRRRNRLPTDRPALLEDVVAVHFA
jgi:2-polyprenyl-6-methoxyphenol hydroxylase-like FAD-dependent oxidoreductase